MLKDILQVIKRIFKIKFLFRKHVLLYTIPMCFNYYIEPVINPFCCV